jgi:hypothetical protein
MNPKTTNTVAKIMKIRLRPHLNVLLSDIIPINGCTMTPLIGPATQTKLNVDLGSPRDNKYGEMYASSTDQEIWIPAMMRVNQIKYHVERMGGVHSSSSSGKGDGERSAERGGWRRGVDSSGCCSEFRILGGSGWIGGGEDSFLSVVMPSGVMSIGGTSEDIS